MIYFLQLLGRFELVSPSGETISISSKKNQALLAMLALADGRPVMRSKMCDLLWQDRGESQARNSLRQALTALRKSFAAHGDFPVAITEEDAAIDKNMLATDIQQLADASGGAATGDFLEGLIIPDQAIQDWLLSERQQIKEKTEGGLSKQMAELLESKNFDSLILTAQALLASDPLNEAAHRAVMQGLAETGDRNKGLRQYQLCRELLKAELGVEPDAETRSLYEQLRSAAGISGTPPQESVPAGKPASAENYLPAITVKQFEDLSGDQKQSQLAGALSRELVTELGHFPTIVVKSSASSSEKAGRHYRLEGSTQHSDQRVRVTAHLIDVASGNQVWGKRYDADLRESFDLQDELARQIAGNLYQPMMTHATNRARQEPVEGSDQHKLYLRAYHHIEHPTADGMREAQQLLEDVLKIDPGYALVYECLAWINFHSSFNGWIKDPWAGLEAARRDAARGLSLDPHNSYLRSVMGLAETYLGDSKRGLAELNEAVSLSPGDAEPRTFLGNALVYIGELNNAHSAFIEADRLSPNYHPIFLYRGDALFAGNRPREAVESYDQFITVLPEYNFAIACKAACHVECDELDQARAAVATVRRQSPFMTCDYLQELLRHKDPAVVNRLLTALEAAGLPGRSKVATPETVPAVALEFPGIAVMPFENLSEGADQAYFSDGLTEDIITALSRFKDLLVIASSSAFTFKGQNLPATDIASQLGVRYVVEGSVRRAGGRVRVTVQLVDGKTGRQMWSERYDRELVDIFAVQDDIANTVVGTVHGRVIATNMRRATQMSPGELEAYDRLLRAWACLNRYTKLDNAQAIDLLQTALDIQPDNATALSYKATAHLMNWMSFWVADRELELEIAVRLARKALELEPEDSCTHWALGEVYQLSRSFDAALHHLKKALDLNPNDVNARNILGFYYSAIGQPDLALQEYKEARRRDPVDLNWTPWLRGISQFTARNYSAALASFRETSIPINEINFWLTVSYAHDGQMDAAQDALRTFISNAKVDMAVFPGENPEDWREYAFAVTGYKDSANIDHLIDGLGLAGLGS